jgi:hypothetical protein
MCDAPGAAITQANVEGYKGRRMKKIANHRNGIHGSNLKD